MSADRCDLARAIEKWGGPSALAEDLAYGVAQRGARQIASKDAKPLTHHKHQLDQVSVLGSIDDDQDEPLLAARVSANPAAAQARSKASSALRTKSAPSQPPAATQQQQQPPKRPQIAGPLDMQAREKQPIVNHRRRVAIRRKAPKLPTMRQEIDEW